MKPQFARKRMFVNSLIQGRIMLRIACYWVIYHIVMWHTLFLFRWAQYRFELMMGGDPMTFGELYGSFCVQYYPIVFAALATAPLLLWDVLKMTHGIAGPLIRFETTLQQMKNGERVDKVVLRDHDLLTEFRDEFNSFLEFYNREKFGEAPAQPVTPTENASTDSLTEEQLHAQVLELQASVAQSTETAESAK